MTNTKRKERCDDVAFIGFATFSWSAKERRQLSAHLCKCERCQVDVAVRLLEWEQRLKDHRLPDTPATIARWRSVAMYLCCAEIPTLRDEQGEVERAGQMDREQGVQRWRDELGGVEEVARAMWCLDANQRERVHAWLEALENLGDTLDRPSAEGTGVPFGEEPS